MESLGNFAVEPSKLPYSISLYVKTRPSEGRSLLDTLSANHPTAFDILSLLTILYSTMSKPSFSKKSICSFLELLKSSSPLELTKENAKNSHSF